MSHAYATDNLLAGLVASNITPSTGPSDATRAYLFDGKMSRPFVFTAGTSPLTLVIDFGSAVTLLGMAMLNHNVKALGVASPTFGVDAADNSGMSTNLVTVKAASAVPTTEPQEKDCVLQFAGNVSKRYWRLIFTWTGGGSYALQLGELYCYYAKTLLTRGSTWGSGEGEEHRTAAVEFPNGEQEAVYFGGPLRETRLTFADLNATALNELRTLKNATRAQTVPFLWIPSYEATATAAAATEQDCIFGRVQEAKWEWTQDDFGIYQPPQLRIRSRGREVGA